MSRADSILDYFPPGDPPRSVQSDVLLAVERAWDSSDVLVITAPTAAGKTKIGRTIQAWAGNGIYAVPSKILVDQAVEQCSGVTALRACGDYKCQQSVACGGEDIRSCYDAARDRSVRGPKGGKGKPIYCRTCPFTKGLFRSRRDSQLICNFHIILAHKLSRRVMIFDEAHELVKLIQDLAAYRSWRCKARYPRGMRSTLDLIRWLESSGYDNKLLADLTSSVPRFIFEESVELYNGQEEACIKLRPVDVRDQPPLFWPSGVKKIVLMSATIGKSDVDALGLGTDRGRRVSYINCASPIPVERRPIYYDPVADMSLKNQTPELMSLIATHLKAAMQYYKGQNGVVHLTYGLAQKLQPYLEGVPNLLWHTSENRSAVYDTFIKAVPNNGVVLFACGLYQGIDLKGDLARWQVLLKVPWPNLGDPAIRHLATTNEDWYNWQALKLVMQFSGRVCRTPDDFGDSLIWDSTFDRLRRKVYAAKMIPGWFGDAVIDI